MNVFLERKPLKYFRKRLEQAFSQKHFHGQKLWKFLF
jgi:hypothetical protein